MGGVHATLRQTPWLEVLVFLPLATLVPFGLYLLFKAGLRYNVKKCKRGGKLRFFLQRVSAVVILGFIAFHLLAAELGPLVRGRRNAGGRRFNCRPLPADGICDECPAGMGLLARSQHVFAHAIGRNRILPVGHGGGGFSFQQRIMDRRDRLGPEFFGGLATAIALAMHRFRERAAGAGGDGLVCLHREAVGPANQITVVRYLRPRPVRPAGERVFLAEE